MKEDLLQKIIDDVSKLRQYEYGTTLQSVKMIYAPELFMLLYSYKETKQEEH